MFLGIEIGGTKLQLGVGRGDGSPLVELRRCDVLVGDGALGVRRQIEAVAPELIATRRPRDRRRLWRAGRSSRRANRQKPPGRRLGGFPLGQWCREALGLPAAVANDSDSAGLAEALFGAGRGAGVVFYTNVGSGIGGALVIDGKLYTGGRGVASELGHLRPGPEAECAGADGRVHCQRFRHRRSRTRSRQARDDRTSRSRPQEEDVADLLRCGGEVDRLSGKMVAEAAAEGNKAAGVILDRALATFGWAIRR